MRIHAHQHQCKFPEYPWSTSHAYVLPLIIGGLRFSMKRPWQTAAAANKSDKTDKSGKRAEWNGHGRQHDDYILPVMIALFTASLPAGVGIYWGASTIYGIIQQLIVNKGKKKIRTNRQRVISDDSRLIRNVWLKSNAFSPFISLVLKLYGYRRPFKETLLKILEHLGTKYSKIIITEDEKDSYTVNIKSEEPSLLIGYHGTSRPCNIYWKFSPGKMRQWTIQYSARHDDYRKDRRQCINLAQRSRNRPQQAATASSTHAPILRKIHFIAWAGFLWHRSAAKAWRQTSCNY